jgi:hypothetical protein
MKAGEGISTYSAWDGESMLHYLWRVCTRYGYNAGPEPPLGDVKLDEKAREVGEEG